MYADKRSKNSLMMWRGLVREKHRGGLRGKDSMIDMKRFKTG